jgi:GTP cyclohydrolase I
MGKIVKAVVKGENFIEDGDSETLKAFIEDKAKKPLNENAKRHIERIAKGFEDLEIDPCETQSLSFEISTDKGEIDSVVVKDLSFKI